jgi:hypothetical protein
MFLRLYQIRGMGYEFFKTYIFHGQVISLSFLLYGGPYASQRPKPDVEYSARDSLAMYCCKSLLLIE